MKLSNFIKMNESKINEAALAKKVLISEYLLNMLRKIERDLIYEIVYRLSGYSIHEIVRRIDVNKQKLAEGNHYSFKIVHFIMSEIKVNRSIAEEIYSMLQRAGLICYRYLQDSNHFLELSIDKSSI